MIFEKVIKLIEMELNHWEGILNEKFVSGIVEVDKYMQKVEIIRQIWNGLKSRILMKENVNAYVYAEVRLLSKQCETIINK